VEKVAGRPISGLRANPSGLTHARTTFVGRSAAIERVAGLLAHHRLVTVTGPGGVGKTRLAAEVLRRVDGRFADGVWVVELAAVQDPALVPAAVATVLDLRPAAGMPLANALVARLSRQQVLLVLDNCEHVIDSIVQLCADVLLAADDTRILITSREPLGLPEEARYRLAPLVLPDPDNPGQAAQSEAVALFVERARLLDPDFSLDSDSGAAVARLVRGLDGMPLAIELAAARVEALGLAQLVERLDDRFRLLVSNNRVAASRQKSLEAAVDWSYQLLSVSEQRVFRFLPVFPGPFTLDAAEAVAGTDAAMPVLRLVDCSLLVPPRTGLDGRSRYSMLETLRGFGAGRLRQLGEGKQAAEALAAYATKVAETATTQIAVRDLEQPAALWLDAEDAAVHQGLAWTLDRDPPAGLRLAVALAPWWLVRGRCAEGYALLQRAVAKTDSSAANWYSAHRWLGELSRVSQSHYSLNLGHFSTVVDGLKERPPSPDLVDGLAGRCAALRNMGRLPEAAEDARTALELARQIRYAAGEADSLLQLSYISMYADEPEDAVKWATQAQRVPSDQIPDWRVRKVQGVLPWALVVGGRLDRLTTGQLEAQCAQVLALARSAGDLGDQADTHYLLAMLAMKTGRLAMAGASLRAAAALATQADFTVRLIDILDDTGHLCVATGRPADAITLWSAMAAQTEAIGLADTQEGEHRRESPLREAERGLGENQVRAARDRGAAMALAAAVEFAVMMTEQVEENVPAPIPAPAPAAQPGSGLLSARERELVALVAQGRTDAEIAEKLFISIRTVRTHLDRIRGKSGYRRRADLTRLALQEGII
jgi:predicted ATPase/DNA-binding CsgD family transcriptional regulator